MKTKIHKEKFRFFSLLASVLLLIILSSCATPHVTPTPHPIILDQEVVDNAPIGSAEIIRCAKELAPQILMLPEISESNGPVKIAISPLTNKSSFILNKEMITDEIKEMFSKLAMESNYTSIRFISTDKQLTNMGNKISQERMEKQIDRVLDEIADTLLASPAITQTEQPPVIAVIPAINANFVNMNADSFVAKLRGAIAGKANGKVRFLLPGETKGADYYLTGEFIAGSMKSEGIVNLVDYISIMEQRMREGKSMDLSSDFPSTKVKYATDGNIMTTTIDHNHRDNNLLKEIQKNSALRLEPNVDKDLNVILVQAESKISVFERMFRLARKQTDNLANAQFILSGNISSISERMGGNEVIYVVIQLKLVDVENNEEIWSGQSKTKKMTRMGGVYM